MKVAIGCDHAGFGLKEAIKMEFRKDRTIEFVDVGTYSTESVDYPDFAKKVVEKVLSGEVDRGILICGTGIGMSITANKFKGIRATLCFNEELAGLSRRHNDSNVLVLPGRFMEVSKAVRMIKIWQKLPFDGGRHERRLEKIKEIERHTENFVSEEKQ